MWYLEKDMFCKEHDLFGCFVIFETVCPSSVFWSVWLSSVIQRTRSTWNLFVHVRVFCTHVKFYDRVHDRILRSRARSYKRSFWSVQGSNPWPCTRSFFVVPGFDSLTLHHDLLWVQGSIPGPDHLFQARSIHGLCHSAPRLEDQVGFAEK